MNPEIMNEQFLSYLWQGRLFGPEADTVGGERIAVLHPGERNTDSGPDFFNARVRIGGTLWAGNVEIHVLASDWYRHGHQGDPAYDRVILHVVWEADRPVFDPAGNPVATLALCGRVPPELTERYERLMMNRQWIPCRNQLNDRIAGTFPLWAPALAAERLEGRTNALQLLLVSCKGDWEEAAYRYLAAGFGFRVNNHAFGRLAASLPLKVVRRYAGDRFRTESLLFGQAGMLVDGLQDDYPKMLRSEYGFLRRKHGLTPMEPEAWKFLRLRPPNFPTLRISQFAGFLVASGAQFEPLVSAPDVRGLLSSYGIAASEYWEGHYLFDKPVVPRPRPMGEPCTDLLAINGVLPFRFFRRRLCETGDPGAGVLDQLERMPGESNVIIRQWKEAGFATGNALQTQALMQLKSAYCDRRRCLECRVGAGVLGGSEVAR